jgi:flagellar hook assembly protein FlgD
MKNFLKNWLIQNLVTTMALAGLFAPQAFAYDLIIPDSDYQFPENPTEEVEAEPAQITEHSISSEYFDPYDQEETEINFCIDQESKVTVGIYKAADSGSDKVSVFSNKVAHDAGCYTYQWDGTYGDHNEIGSQGETADYGDYFYGITLKNLDSEEKEDYVSDWVYVSENGAASTIQIIDSEVDNSSFDPWDGQETELTFTIATSAYVSVDILDDDNDLVLELVDNLYYEAGEYTVEWDGDDEYGDIVSQGDYKFKLRIEKDDETDKVYESVRVKKGANDYYDFTEDPRLKNVYTTKDEFDPGRNETNYIVFTLTAEADLTVTIKDKYGEEVEELVDTDNAAPGTYVVLWDGDLAIGEDDEYDYIIHAENSKGEVTEEGEIEVEEDVKPSNKPNIYKNHVDSLPYNPHNQNLGIYFKLEERDAEVTIEIRDGSKTIAEITDEQYFAEGAHTVYWNGIDKYGELVDNGVYKYKIVAENSKGKDTEYGTFSVEGASYAQNPQGACGVFWDVDGDSPYCEAIEWAYLNDVFQGYYDSSFKPDQAITRAESLKVVLESNEISLLPGGANLGYTDVPKYEWYNAYIRTAMSLGIVQGYNDNTFRPNTEVTRVEALKILLETGEAKGEFIVPTNTYGQPYFDTPNNADTKWYLSYVWFAKAYELNFNNEYFYPNDYMTRAEMADMLYRYHLAGF